MDRIVDWLIDIEVVSEEAKEVYLFGLRQGMLYAINAITCIVIAAMTNNYWGVFIYIGAFAVLRAYAGGYHAESVVACYLTSTGIVLTASYLITHYEFDTLLLLMVLMLSTMVILLFSPVEDHHKPLDAKEELVYSLRIRLVLSIELVLIIAAVMMNRHLFVEAATYGITTVAIVVLLGWVKNIWSTKVKQ